MEWNSDYASDNLSNLLLQTYSHQMASEITFPYDLHTSLALTFIYYFGYKSISPPIQQLILLSPSRKSTKLVSELLKPDDTMMWISEVGRFTF